MDNLYLIALFRARPALYIDGSTDIRPVPQRAAATFILKTKPIKQKDIKNRGGGVYI